MSQFFSFAIVALVQSSLVISMGLLTARLIRERGSALQSFVLRATLVSVLACPIASCLYSRAGVSGVGLFIKDASPKITHLEHGYLASLPMENVSGASFERMENAKPTSESSSETSTFLESISMSSIDWYALVVWIWGLVALALLARIGIANWLLSKKQASGVSPGSSAIEACQRVAREISVARDIRVAVPRLLVTPFVGSPCLVGIFRPTILIPESMSGLERDVLLHELAHLQRRDCIWQLISGLASAVLWCQPLIWLLGRAIQDSAENVADDFVVQYGLDRTEYARKLVAIAESFQPDWPVAQAGTGVFSLRSSLAGRVNRILDTSRLVSTRVEASKGSLVVGASVVAILLIGLVNAGTVAAQARTDELKSASVDVAGQEMTTFFGRVTDSNGNPIANAKLYHMAAIQNPLPEGSENPLEVVRSVTNKDGQFQYSIAGNEYGNLVPRLNNFGTIVVSAEGFGITAVNLHDQKPSESFEITMPKERMLGGRVVDLQGQPIANATVRFNALKSPKSNTGGVPEWRQALAERAEGMKMERQFFAMSTLAANLRPADVKTDSDGRFQVRGFGDGQVVALIIEGPNIQSQEINVVLSSGFDRITVPWYANADALGKLQYIGVSDDIVAPPTSPLIGYVRDLETDAPLAGFKVAGKSIGNPLHRIETTTDNQGRFTLTGLKVGQDQTITVTSSDEEPYVTVEQQVSLGPSEEPTSVTLKSPRGVWVEGKVFDVSTGNPLAANLAYFVANSNQAYRSYRDLRMPGGLYSHRTNDGNFRIPVYPGKGIIAARAMSDQHLMGVGAEDVTIVKTGDGFSTSPFICHPRNFHTLAEIDPGSGAETVSVDLGIDPGGTASIQIRNPLGEAIGGNHVRGKHSMSYWRETEEPNFKVTGLLGSKERRVIVWNEPLDLVGQAFVGAGSDSVAIELQPAGRLRGTLLDDDGDPWTDVTIRAINHDHGPPSGIEHDFPGLPQSVEIRTDSKGNFEIQGLLPDVAYSFAISVGYRTVWIIENAKVQSGQMRDIGDVAALPDPHERD